MAEETTPSTRLDAAAVATLGRAQGLKIEAGELPRVVEILEEYLHLADAVEAFMVADDESSALVLDLNRWSDQDVPLGS